MKKMDLVFERCLAMDLDFPILDSPIWLFGRSFSIHYDLDELRRTVGSCIWLTYRKNFPSIPPTSLTSDKGWGCMIRCGQMMIAKALLRRHLGPHWYWEHTLRTKTYLQILALFEDTSSALLSLHEISKSGASLGKPIGSWLGPNTVAQALKRILSTSAANAVDLEMVIAMDSSLVRSEVKRSCLKTHLRKEAKSEVTSLSVPVLNTPRESSRWKPLVLVVPLRLGLSQLNPEYVPAFRTVFEVKQNIGILGGRPNSALYFIGYAEDEVLFLDPHTVQSAVTVGGKIFETEIEADASYHISKPGRMPFAAMDPSLAVCFYCSSEEDFDELCTDLKERWATTPLPLFEICEDRPTDWTPSSLSSSACPGESWTKVDAPNCSNHSPNNSRPSPSPSSQSHEDDFEILG